MKPAAKPGEIVGVVWRDFKPGGELTVTALVRNPEAGETLTLAVPDGFAVRGAAEQTVPVPAPEERDRNRPDSIQGRDRS